jgi:hypothetical protein
MLEVQQALLMKRWMFVQELVGDHGFVALKMVVF